MTTEAKDKTDSANRRFEPGNEIFFVRKSFGGWFLARYTGNGNWFPLTGFYAGCRHWAPAEFETPFDEINKTTVTYENFIKHDEHI